MSLTLISPPAVEPVTLAEAKLQCGLSPREDADPEKEEQNRLLLRRYIRTARADVEGRLKRAIITQTWRWVRTGWPGRDSEYAWFGMPALVLPLPKFQRILQFTYTDVEGKLQDMVTAAEAAQRIGTDDPTNYTQAPWGIQLEPGGEDLPARIIPPYATPWPPLLPVQSNVLIDFVCGYGDTPADVPSSVTQAILFLVHSYYEPAAYKDVDTLVNNLIDREVNRNS